MPATLPPESEWFRPPRFFETCRKGDTRTFCWVAEPQAPSERKGKLGIAAVYYRVAETLLVQYEDVSNLFELLRALALKELHARIDREEFIPEGASLSRMAEWFPVITRHEDGTCEIKGLPKFPQMEMTFDAVEPRSGA